MDKRSLPTTLRKHASILIRFSNSTDTAGLVSLPNISSHHSVSEAQSIKELSELYTKYLQDIQIVKSTAESRKKDGYNKQCHYNGKLSKEIHGTGTSFFVCRCDSEYLGENCELRRELYNSIQKKVVTFLHELAHRIATTQKLSKSHLIEQLLLVSKFFLNRKIVKKMLHLIKGALSRHTEQFHRKKLFKLYDQMLLICSDMLYDIRRETNKEILADLNTQRESQKIYKLADSIIAQIEATLEKHSLLNSFIEDEKSETHIMHTRSYSVNEFKLKGYDSNRGLRFANPNIDDSFNLHRQTRLFMHLIDGKHFDNSQYHLQVLNFSSSFFEKKLAEFNDFPASNIVYLKYIHPMNYHKKVSHENVGTKYIEIAFALTYIPAYDDVLSNVNCVAYRSSGLEPKIYGKPIEFDEDNALLRCQFYTYFNFKRYYFMVTIKKD